jgi:hypothetical protein
MSVGSEESKDLFNKLKNDLLNVDPVYWAENHLTLDGKPFRVHGNGYKPFADIYRYMGIKALEPTAKPLIIVAGRQVGKDLAIDTPIPTPNGWKIMADLQVGDKVFDENGDTCDITWVSPIFTDHKCYELTFDDGSKIIAGEDHQWLTCTEKASEAKIRTTKEVFSTINENHSIRTPAAKTPYRYIVSCIEVPTIPTKCISVNSPSNLYLASKSFIPTHNTTLLSVLEMYFMGAGIFGNGGNPPVRMIHAFPHLELAAAYSKTKLNQMISSAVPAEVQSDKKSSSKPKSCMQVLLDQTTATNDSLHFKQFSGGNHLWVESTGLDADRIMGRSADIMAFDEVQKTTSHAIGNALKILTTAKYGPPSKGVQVYVGTPRGKGSDFHKLWLCSSQQYFYLGCEQCREHFPLYTPGSDDWKSIWIYGMVVKCPKCGHEQNKLEAQERGKWVSIKDPNDPDCKMIGFHVSQIYMPMFTREDIINEMPGIHPLNTERTFMNEVLGEFFQGDSSPITQEEIRENCADVGRKFRARIDPSNEDDRNQLVVMGIDYGARADLEQMANPEKLINRGQSYSTAVILTAKDAGRLSIEFCTKFKRNDTESKKGLIDQLMRQYSVQLAVGDIGFSEDFSSMLHNSYGDRYLVSRAHNKVNGHVKFSIDAFPKEIVFERDHYMGELFEQMKKGMIRFPFGDYEKIAWLIDHCCSMEIKPSISRGGDPSIHYVKGSTANDGFAALLNAYIAYKFLLTNGFTNNNPLLHQQDFKQANKPLVMTGVISRRI